MHLNDDIGDASSSFRGSTSSFYFASSVRFVLVLSTFTDKIIPAPTILQYFHK